MAISMLKIRRPLGRLIFNMGIAIPGKTVFLIETAPRTQNFLGTQRRISAGLSGLRSCHQYVFDSKDMGLFWVIKHTEYECSWISIVKL